jgi:hypothetical protein
VSYKRKKYIKNTKIHVDSENTSRTAFKHCHSEDQQRGRSHTHRPYCISRRFSRANIQCTLLGCVRGVSQAPSNAPRVRPWYITGARASVRTLFVRRSSPDHGSIPRTGITLSAALVVILRVKSLPEASCHNVLA